MLPGDRKMSFSFNYLALLLLLSGGFWSAIARGTLAQITPDKSLGNEGSIVTPNATVKDALADLISGGAVRGNNLFHSFSEFNVPDGGRVYFANPDGITNILTRVTGNNFSQILGIVGVDGAANLFLLNPNGIVFGENASLDVNGSFLATTADSYVFNNGFAYSASNPNQPPLLTINMPVGLQFGQKAEAIVNHAQSLQRNHPVFDFPITIGLQVQPEKNITLLGGDILLEGGGLTAPHGRIELGSVTPNSFVTLKPNAQNWTLDYEGVTAFQNLLFSNNAIVNTSGSGGGDFQIQGRQIRIIEDSSIFAETFGKENGGKSIIKASELVEVIGNSLIVLGVYDQGDGGDLTIQTKELLIKDNPTIGTDTFSEGNSGNIDIEVERLLVKGGGQIGAATRDKGNSGDMTIKAKEIDIIGTSCCFEDGFYSSGLFASAEPGSSGNAGNLTIETESLRIADGGLIAVDALGQGNAGNVNITANSIQVTGVSEDSQIPSRIAADSEGNGAAGSVNLNTDSLLVQNRAEVLVSSKKGDAGNINIITNSLHLDQKGSLKAEVNAGSQGNINLTTDKIFLFNNSEINATATGTATGGNIAINNTENIVLLDNSKIIADAIDGMGGNINITTQGLFVSPDSAITASSEFGLDGNVEVETINSDRSLELEQLPENPIQATEQITSGCTKGNNQFALTGKGALSENPGQNLRGETVWQDLRLPLDKTTNFTTNDLPLEQNSSQSTIVEAQAWKINPQGKVELVAVNSYLGLSFNPYQCSQITSH
jgi:filamentous hemagglutinin family protein